MYDPATLRHGDIPNVPDDLRPRLASCIYMHTYLLHDPQTQRRSASNKKEGMEKFLDLKGLITSLSLAYLVYRYLIYPAFISPLSKIPAAHWTARVSPAWILWKRYSFQADRTIHAAHKRYGTVVRLGPNELSVNCVDDGIRTIYAGGFEKHQWYPNLFTNYDGYD